MLATAFAALVLAPALAGAGTLWMADSTDIAAMDPHSMTESSTIGFLHHVYEPLVRYNDALEVEPALAESWEVVEPTRVRFHLREDVTFHNGNRLAADDLVASIERAIDPDSPVKGNLPAVESAGVSDASTPDSMARARRSRAAGAPSRCPASPRRTHLDVAAGDGMAPAPGGPAPDRQDRDRAAAEARMEH